MTPMLFGFLAMFGLGFGIGVVVGLRMHSHRILDAAMERELAPAALPRGVAARTAVRRAVRGRAATAKAADNQTAGGAA